MSNKEKTPVVIRPEWIDTAKVSLVNRKSKKEYLRFLEMLAELVSNSELSSEFCDQSKAYKLLKSLMIQEQIDNDLKRYRKKKSRYFAESDNQKSDNQETNSGIEHIHRTYSIEHNSINNSIEQKHNSNSNDADCNADAVDMTGDYAEIDRMF